MRVKSWFAVFLVILLVALVVTYHGCAFPLPRSLETSMGRLRFRQGHRM